MFDGRFQKLNVFYVLLLFNICIRKKYVNNLLQVQDELEIILDIIYTTI